MMCKIIPICVFLFIGVLVRSTCGLIVDLYVHKDKYGQSLQMDVSQQACTNVPRPWINFTRSIDTHGSCMQFYDQLACKGKIAVIQPFHTVHQMDLSLINFDNAIQSVSPCGPKAINGRYVIQNALDATILTVSKRQGQFATVNTLPARPFIPKSQQWVITETHPNEYDIKPRIHEDNYPVTYDTKAMKKGSFIRKTWKIESVGRGRYIIKSEWTGKCLYKTRYRSVEEHDCQAWSPNQEWILRPLLTSPVNPARPKPDKKPIPGNIPLTIPSRVVDQVLNERKRQREEFLQSLAADDETSNSKSNSEESESQSREDYIKPYTGPYKVRRRKDKTETQDTKVEPSKQKNRHKTPPRPNVLFKHPPHPTLLNNRAHEIPKPQVQFINGAYPVFQTEKVEDPIFPNFLMNAIYKPQYDLSSDKKQDDEDTNNDSAVQSEEEDEFSPQKYAVTRRPPTIPLPVGHPNYIPPKPKYGKVVYPERDIEESEESDSESQSVEEDNNGGYVPQGDNQYAPPPPDSQSQESIEQPEQENNAASPEEEQSSVETSTEDDSQEKSKPSTKYVKDNYNFYTGFENKVDPQYDYYAKTSPKQKSSEESVESDEDESEEDLPSQGEPYERENSPERYSKEEEEDIAENSAEDDIQEDNEAAAATEERHRTRQEAVEESTADDNKNAEEGDEAASASSSSEEEESNKENEEKVTSEEKEFKFADEEKDQKRIKPIDMSDDEADLLDEEDPYDDDASGDVASFMKLLFKGIATRMTNNIRQEEDMVNMFERRKGLASVKNFFSG